MTEPESRPPPLTFYNPAAVSFDPEVVVALIADTRVRAAIEQGEFDNLPGMGKPLDLSDRHDPDWWIKSLMKRDGLVILPPSIQLRKDDAELDDRLDKLSTAAAVRAEVEEFNERVIRARYEPSAGPPLVTMPRDLEATVSAWYDRRAVREADARKRSEEEARARQDAKQSARFSRRLSHWLRRRASRK